MLAFPLGEAAAQLPAPGVPRGVVRVGIGTSFASTTERWVGGEARPWFAALASDFLGADAFPELADADARLGALVGDPGYRVSLGISRPAGFAERGALRLGVDVGLGDRLTVYGALPIVRTKVRLQGSLDPLGANAGLNPSHPVFGSPAGREATAAFLTDFGASLVTLQTRLAAGDYDADPARRALAEATLVEGAAFRDALIETLFADGTAAPFTPTVNSTAGIALRGEVEDYRTTLEEDLGIVPFAGGPALPEAVATRDDLYRYIGDPNGPIAAQNPSEPSITSQPGDAEVGLLYTLVDAWDPQQRRGGVRLSARLAARLPTAGAPAPGDVIAIPPGDGQFDLEGELVADLGTGPVGARAVVQYTQQFASTDDRRIAAPDVVYPTRDRLTSVRTDPGNRLLLGVQPFLRLAPGFALTGRVLWMRRGDDAITVEGTAPAGLDPADLAIGTGGSTLLVGGGLSYAGPRTPGDRSAPPEAFLEVRQVVSATDIRVPRWVDVSAGLRFSFRLWGSPPAGPSGRPVVADPLALPPDSP